MELPTEFSLEVYHGETIHRLGWLKAGLHPRGRGVVGPKPSRPETCPFPLDFFIHLGWWGRGRGRSMKFIVTIKSCRNGAVSRFRNYTYTAVSGSRHCEKLSLRENNLWAMTISEAKYPLRKVKLWWKTTFDESQPLMKKNLWLKTNFDKNYLCWEIILDGRRALIEDNFWWWTSFDERQLSTEDILWL